MHFATENILEVMGYIALGAGLAIPLLLLNIRLAPALGMIDWPKARGLAEEQIPIVGPSLVAFTLGILGLVTYLYGLSPWILTTATLMAIMGHVDDQKPLSALDKMFFQVLCAAVVVLLDPQLRSAMSAKYGVAGSAFAFIFIVGLINAINFIDGIDGLAGLVIFMGSLGYILLSYVSGPFAPYIVCASVIVGMMVPFLYCNVVKRRGFLGNVGSYFFSYLLAVMHLSIPISASSIFPRLSVTTLCFLIPLADSFMVTCSRVLTGRSPFHADKGHLHHRMVQTSITLRYILLIFGIIELSGVLTSYLTLQTPGATFSWLPVATCLSYLTIAGLLILMGEKASKKRIQTYFERLDGGNPIYYFKYEIINSDGTALSSTALRRLEARVSAEIRVSDVCFTQSPNRLFVSLATVAEPLKGISVRLDSVFQAEGVQATMTIEHGEIVKVTSPAPKPVRLPSRKRAS